MINLIDRHGPCIGIRLWKSGQKFVQLWIIPPNYIIEPHSHDDENIELMYLWGKTTFWRAVRVVKSKFYHNDELIEKIETDEEGFIPTRHDVGRCFSVPAGTMHWFKTTSTRLIFINFSTFIKGKSPRSAALDFNTQQH